MSAQPACFHRLDEILVSTTENVDSIVVVVASIRRSQPCNGSRCTVSVSSRPSSSERAADWFNSCNSPCNVSGFHDVEGCLWQAPVSCPAGTSPTGTQPPGTSRKPPARGK